MNYLLIAGAPSVGKSQSIYRLVRALLASNKFFVMVGNFPSTFCDFKIILEGSFDNKSYKRILINSATDTTAIIEDLRNFYVDNFYVDMVISSIRDYNFYPRSDFYNIMHLNPENDFILEIPLAKITRRGSNFKTALNWYERTIDELIIHTLTNQPYDI